ncbi:MAG: hypothetical protein QOD26_560 [Betaproteobacteria bacterium]|nr:hypothetical protein [Betaproteobacteria bacterium]
MAAHALAGLLFAFGTGLVLGAGPLPDAATLAVIGNTLRHEAPPPPTAPPLVRELLDQPLAALDAGAIFERAVPRPLVDAAVVAPPPAPQPFQRLLAEYIEELVRARAELLVATGNAPFDEAAMLADLRANGHPSADRLLQVAMATDLDGLAVANERFLIATMRFARALRTATDLPHQPTRIETAIGTVVVGSRGNDRHAPGAALIIDPGGDDIYERAPATGGAVSVVIDLDGNDTYNGADVAVRGFSAIVDFAGDDRYEMQGPGLGAAVAGASLLLDLAGNDTYRVPHVGQGMAAFGIGALLDLGGDDRYDLDAWGQGFGLAGGLGLLWDAAGNDRYAARGPADAFDRGGGLSGAQGAGMGPRTLLAGGIGILRDDAGDDEYIAEMFAQGTGYFYGLGLLWDRGGNDRYQAVRYAQGTGVHEAVGVLRDEAGDDRYELRFGVGQGMGLDLALGVLADASGDDAYTAGVLAQATATANGIGVLHDAGGADRFEIGSGERQWGQAEWLRGLPSTGVFVYDTARATFRSAGAALPAPPPPKKVFEAEPVGACPAGIKVDPAELGTVRREHFDAMFDLGQRLRCALADPAQSAALWPALDSELQRDPASALAAWIAIAFRFHPPPAPLRDSVLERLDAHPYCSVRVLALEAARRADVARRALAASCFRLQATAVRTLEKLGAPVPKDAPLPAFLR